MTTKRNDPVILKTVNTKYIPESSVTLLVATKKIQKGQEIINTYNLNLQQFN